MDEETPESPASSETNQEATLQAQSIDFRAELETLNRRALSEQAAELDRLRSENARLARANETQQNTSEDDASALLANPRKLINEEMHKVVAPLIEFKQQYDRDRQYQSLLGQIQSNTVLWQKYLEVKPLVDQIMATVEPTPQNFQSALIQAAGAVSLGLVQGVQTQQAQIQSKSAQAGNNQATPPYIPPSPPPAPKQGGTDKEPIITESEREMMKRMGIKTVAEYIQLRDAPSEVAAWGGAK